MPVDPITDRLIDIWQPPREAAQTLNYTNGLDPNPGAAQKALELANKSNLPAPLIQTDPEAYAKDIRRQQNAKILEGNDDLSKFVIDNPVAAQAAYNEYDKLDTVSRALQGLKTGWTRGGLQEQRGEIGYRALTGDEKAPAEAQSLDEQLKSLPDPQGWVEWAAQGLAGVGAGLAAHAQGAVGGAIIGTAVPGLGTGAGFAAGLAQGFGRTGAGNAYLTLSQARDANGQPLPEAAKIGGAIVVGAANAAAGMVGVNVAGSALQNAVGTGVRQALENPTVAKAITNAVGEVVKGGASGAGIMGALQTVTELVTDVVKGVSPGEWKTLANDPARRQEIADNVTHAMTDAAGLFGLLHLPGAGRSAVADGLRIRQAAKDAAALDATINAGGEVTSKEALQALIDSHQEQPQLVGISGERMLDMIQNDPESYAKLRARLGGDITSLAQDAAARGDDVHLPLGQLLMEPEVLSKLRDDVRMRPEGFTVNEAKEVADSQPQYAREDRQTPTPENVKEPAVAEGTRQRRAAWLDPLLRPEGDKPPLNMTEAEYAKYSDAQERLQATSERKAEALADREVSKRQTEEWKKNEREVGDEVRTDLRYRPDILVDNYLRDGRLPNDQVGERVRLDRSAVEAILGEKEQLPRGFTTEKGGVHPDEIAPLFGYQSGQQMLTDLMALHRQRELANLSPKKHFDRLVADETARRMEERYGKLDENIAAEAQEMVVQRAQSEVLGAELEALSRAGDVPIDRAIIEANIHESFARMDLETARNLPGFMRAVARNGRAAELALLKGDIAAAFQAKQKQYIAHVMAQSAKALAKDYAGFERMTDRFKEKVVPTVAQEYTDQIHGLMTELGLPTKRNEQELISALEGKPLREFVQGKIDEGREVPVAPFVTDHIPNTMHDMTVQQFHDLNDSIKTLVHNGREEKQIMVAGEKADLAETVAMAEQQTAVLAPRYLPRDPGVIERLKSGLYSWDAMLLKMEQLFDWLDLNDPHGVFNQVVFRPLSEAKNRENDLRKQFGEEIRNIKSATPGWLKTLNNKITEGRFIDFESGAPMDLTRRDLIGMMLHVGNESNFSKLTAKFEFEGKQYGHDPSNVLDFIHKNATKADWDFVQSIWDLHEKLWPEIEALSRRMSGIAPDKIEPRPIATSFGTYKGGYMPVDADPRWIGTGTAQGKGLFEAGNYFRATPPKGYTLERSDAGYPVDLNFNRIADTLNQVIHDISFREALVNADKFLRQTEIRRGIQRAFGPEYLEQVQPWLENIAFGKQASLITNKALTSLARLAYQPLVAVQLMYRASTAIKHGIAALLDSFGESKNGVDFLDAAKEIYFAKDLGAAKIRWIMEQSGELRNRQRDYDRDIRYQVESSEMNTGAWAWYKHNGGIATGTIDMGSALPTWLMAYKRAIAEGQEHGAAVYEGDKAVRNAHGSSGQIDLAPIQRSDDVTKAMTVAYSFFNHNYNRLRNIGHQVVQGNFEGAKAFGLFGRAAWGSLWYLGLMAAVEEWVSPIPHKEGEDESWGHWLGMGVAHQALSTQPVIRDVARDWLYGRHATAANLPVYQLASSFGQFGKNIYKVSQDEEPSKTYVRNAFETAGYAFALPGFGQLGATAQFLHDLESGRQSVEGYGLGYGGFARGFLLGKTHPEIKK